MKTYRVLATYTNQYDVVIEAENEDEAWEIASNLNYNSLEADGYGDWSVNEVEEEA
jgi:hypothetical protein